MLSIFYFFSVTFLIKSSAPCLCLNIIKIVPNSIVADLLFSDDNWEEKNPVHGL